MSLRAPNVRAVDAFMAKKKAFSTYPREDFIELYDIAYDEGFKDGAIPCVERLAFDEMKKEKDAAVASARRWKALAKLLHADEVHYHYVEPCGQKIRAVASRSAKLALQLARAVEVVEAAIRLRDSIMTDSDPLIDDVQVSGLLTNLETYERGE